MDAVPEKQAGPHRPDNNASAHDNGNNRPCHRSWDYRECDYGHFNEFVSSRHWFGTDYLGRDMFTRLWHGTRISLFIGVTAALIDLVIGVMWGGIAGYFGGVVDDIMMRIVDILYGIPYLLVVILLLVVMEPAYVYHHSYESYGVGGHGKAGQGAGAPPKRWSTCLPPDLSALLPAGSLPGT